MADADEFARVVPTRDSRLGRDEYALRYAEPDEAAAAYAREEAVISGKMADLRISTIDEASLERTSRAARRGASDERVEEVMNLLIRLRAARRREAAARQLVERAEAAAERELGRKLDEQYMYLSNRRAVRRSDEDIRGELLARAERALDLGDIATARSLIDPLREQEERARRYTPLERRRRLM